MYGNARNANSRGTQFAPQPVAPLEAARITAFGGFVVNVIWFHILFGEFSHATTSVDSRADMTKAVKVARGVSGVTSVKNDMRLKQFRPGNAAVSIPAAVRGNAAAAFTHALCSPAYGRRRKIGR